MGYVYFFSGRIDGEVKIGRTDGPLDSRLVLGWVETDEPATCERHLRSLLEARRLPGSREWFKLTRAQVDEASRRARDWAAGDLPTQLEVARLATEPSDGRLLAPDTLARDLCTELRRLRADEYRAKVRTLRVENQLRLLICTADGIRGVATWKAHTQRRFQQARFRERYEDLFERFVAPVQARPFRLL